MQFIGLGPPHATTDALSSAKLALPTGMHHFDVFIDTLSFGIGGVARNLLKQT